MYMLYYTKYVKYIPDPLLTPSSISRQPCNRVVSLHGKVIFGALPTSRDSFRKIVVRDAPLDFKGGAGSFCKKKKNLTHSKVKKKKTWPTHRRKKKLDPHGKKNKNLSCLGEKKTFPHIEEGGKVHTWDLSYSEGRGEATLKKRVSFWSVTMTFPSKVQPAGGCFELQTLYGACRVFVLKSSKSEPWGMRMWSA